MTHLEKILSYCALVPKIEPYWNRQKKFEQKHPNLIWVILFCPVLVPPLIAWAQGDLAHFSFSQMMLTFVSGMAVLAAALLGWNAIKRRKTYKKLGYSIGAMEDSATEKQIHAILEKLLHLPATPQTQELKTQLWDLAEKKFVATALVEGCGTRGQRVVGRCRMRCP